MNQNKNIQKSKSQQVRKSVPKKGWDKIFNSSVFGKFYAGFSIAVLLATTVFWSILSANVQRGNADQLVNSFLFEHAGTFQAALLPGQHSFLLKWPLFWLVKLFGSTPTTFSVFTVGIVLITVAALAAIMYRIDRRPLVFGTLCLALASVLLLVPAQPYAGGLLPVNMAMLATRNVEYVLYIVCLAALVRSPRLRSRGFWFAIVGLIVLAASDKLFLILGIGGAFLALVWYALIQGWKFVSVTVRWFIGGLVAAAGASATLLLLTSLKVTHIVSQSGTGPYSVVHSVQSFGLGSVYAVLGLFTNFGANPAYDATIVRNIPHQLSSRLLSISGPAYAINAAILAAGLFVVYHLVVSNIAGNKQKDKQLDRPSILSIMLIWTTLAAFIVFVASNHYYAVDARYLTISLFTVFIAMATWLRKKRWPASRLVMAGIVITTGIILGLLAAKQSSNNDIAAMATISSRNSVIAQILVQHPVKVLVGDYWRVIPTKLQSGNTLNVMPLSNCLEARDTLTSKAWEPNLQTNSFAYLLSLDQGLTDYPSCSLQQVTAHYGRPNASTLVAGSLKQPKELLLFYDYGIHKSDPKTPSPPSGPTTVVPISLDQLPNTACNVQTAINIVAHQDDDLLFINPDIQKDVAAEHCIRTIYMTAGDGGAGKFYWLSREKGSEAAYSKMLGVSNIWIEKIVQITSNEFVTIANPKGNSKVSIIFMHLPDGNLKGEGFSDSHYESLARLDAAKISVIHTVDGQSSYTAAQLSNALNEMMLVYQPTVIRTQANYVSSVYPDHSDHMAVGRFVKRAYKQYEEQQYGNLITIPIKFYIGYPVHAMPENVSGTDLISKESAFFEYAKFDGSVCHNVQQCAQTPTYNAYLHRQYLNAY